jgi:uncharacterized protein (DUF1697 family)
VSDELYQKGINSGAKATDGALSVYATEKYFPELAKVQDDLYKELGRSADIRVYSSEGFEKIIKETPNYITVG